MVDAPVRLGLARGNDRRTDHRRRPWLVGCKGDARSKGLTRSTLDQGTERTFLQLLQPCFRPAGACQCPTDPHTRGSTRTVPDKKITSVKKPGKLIEQICTPPTAKMTKGTTQKCTPYPFSGILFLH